MRISDWSSDVCSSDLQYVPLFWKFTAEINGSVGYVDSYGNDDVPPWENYFAGGPQTVRGYKDGYLGPRDHPSNLFNNPYGGKLRTTAQTNVIIPLPIASDGKSTRLEALWDVGNVFAEPRDFDTSPLR